MPEAAFDLEMLRIPSPCPADWDAMPGDDRVRHCGACRLDVYNIAGLSRDEAETLIASHEGRVCLRLYRRLDGRIVTKDCVAVRAGRLKRVAALTAAFSLVLAVHASSVLGRGGRSPVSQGTSDAIAEICGSGGRAIVSQDALANVRYSFLGEIGPVASVVDWIEETLYPPVPASPAYGVAGPTGAMPPGTTLMGMPVRGAWPAPSASHSTVTTATP
ncbi:MAG: hypothetical protein U0166_10570 [Acidobacteriota bacterium]